MTNYNSSNLTEIYKVVNLVTGDGYDTQLDAHQDTAYVEINIFLGDVADVPITDATQVADLKIIEAKIAGGAFLESRVESTGADGGHRPRRCGATEDGWRLLKAFKKKYYSVTARSRVSGVHFHKKSTRRMYIDARD